jgi:transposase
LRKPQLRQPLLVEEAMGKQALARLAALDTACIAVEDLGQAAAVRFQQHPDYAIITSFPGLADSTGARVLAEIGADRTRFADASALKAYAGSAPITRASGRSISITHRQIKKRPSRGYGLYLGLRRRGKLPISPPALPASARTAQQCRCAVFADDCR